MKYSVTGNHVITTKMDVQTFNELVDIGCEKLGTRWKGNY